MPPFGWGTVAGKLKTACTTLAIGLLDVVAPPFTLSFQSPRLSGSHKTWDPRPWAVPFPLHPSGLVPGLDPVDRPPLHRRAPLSARGLGFIPTPTPAGTRVVLTMGNVTASFALDGLVLGSTPLSQFCWHVVDRQPPLVTTPVASLHRSRATAFTTLQPSPHGRSPLSPHASFSETNSQGRAFGSPPLHARHCHSRRPPTDVGVEYEGTPWG